MSFQTLPIIIKSGKRQLGGKHISQFKKGKKGKPLVLGDKGSRSGVISRLVISHFKTSKYFSWPFHRGIEPHGEITELCGTPYTKVWWTVLNKSSPHHLLGRTCTEVSEPLQCSTIIPTLTLSNQVARCVS